ncbi:hypothetical protein [Runella aurantiaca]|uniref:hypothetical protein n=1 Tax=Runella aurantiaca TaxID=2282308 RepID=UPI0011C07ABC|nr:hypothetical protein [Runella aurantiaca]
MLIIYLFSATELNQLLKLPVLVMHFQEHQQKNSSISFFQFLHNHYAINHADDGDAERDSQLPFQSNDHSSSFQSPFYFFLSFTPLSPSITIIKEGNPSYYTSAHILAAHLSTIWQPPRFI